MDAYESLGVIGEGTYGVVIKARHKSSGHLVAIKRFKEGEEDEQTRKTSLREVRVLKQLRHDNVVTLLDVFRRKGKLHLVFEHIGEGTILEVLEQKGGAATGSRGTGFFDRGLSEMDVKKVMYQLLKGLQYCHAQNIVHRDIKPENILVSKEGAVKLCDFGFARSMGNSTAEAPAAAQEATTNLPSTTTTGGSSNAMFNTAGVGIQNGGLGTAGNKFTEYVATRWYRAPELLVGDVDYGKGVDVWAVGCILAEISNSLPLFPGESDLDQLAHILRCNGAMPNRFVQCFLRNPLYRNVDVPPMKIHEPLPERFPTAPKPWLHFIVSCLKNDPADRATCTYLLSPTNPFPFFEESGRGSVDIVCPIGLNRQVGVPFDRTTYEALLAKLFAKESAERNRMFGRASPVPSDTGKVAKSDSKSGKPKRDKGGERRSKTGLEDDDMPAKVDSAATPDTLPPATNTPVLPSNTNSHLWSQYVASAAHELPELGTDTKYRNTHLPPAYQAHPAPQETTSSNTPSTPLVNIGKQPAKRGSDSQHLPSLTSVGGGATPTQTSSNKGLPSLGGPQHQQTPQFMVSNTAGKSTPTSELEVSGNGSQPSSSHMSTKPANGTMASQLGYKKKTHKKNVLLSSLSANSFSPSETGGTASMPSVSGTSLNHDAKGAPSSSSHEHTYSTAPTTTTHATSTIKHKSTYSGLDPFGNTGRFGGLTGGLPVAYGRNSPTAPSNPSGVYGHGMSSLQPLNANNPYRTSNTKGK